jgi:hypothetical protein
MFAMRDKLPRMSLIVRWVKKRRDLQYLLMVSAVLARLPMMSLSWAPSPNTVLPPEPCKGCRRIPPCPR